MGPQTRHFAHSGESQLYPLQNAGKNTSNPRVPPNVHREGGGQAELLASRVKTVAPFGQDTWGMTQPESKPQRALELIFPLSQEGKLICSPTYC